MPKPVDPEQQLEDQEKLNEEDTAPADGTDEGSDELEAAVDRISRKLRERKRRTRAKRITKRVVWILFVLAIVGAVTYFLVKYWDVFKPDNFRETVTMEKSEKSLLKIGGALDIITGNTARYVSFSDGLAVVSTSTIRYATEDGEEGFLAEAQLSQPAVATAAEQMLIYDRGGRTMICADKTDVLAQGEALGGAISMSINDHGRISAVTECVGYQCAVSVYDLSLNRLYTWRTPEYFAVQSLVSDDNKYLAAAVADIRDERLNMSLLIFDLQEEGVQYEIPIGSDGVAGLFPSGDGFLAITETEVIRIAWDGTLQSRVTFDGDELVGLVRDGGSIYLLLNDIDDITAHYRLLRIGEDGGIAAELRLKNDVYAIHAANGMVAVLTGDQIRLYDDTLSIKKYVSPEPGVTDIILLRDHKLIMVTAQEILIV